MIKPSDKVNITNFSFLVVYCTVFLIGFREQCSDQSCPDADILCVTAFVYIVTTILMISLNNVFSCDVHELNLSTTGLIFVLTCILQAIKHAESNSVSSNMVGTTANIVHIAIVVHHLLVFNAYADLYLLLCDYYAYKTISARSRAALPFSVLDLRGQVPGLFYQTTFRLKQLLKFVPCFSQ